MSLAAIPRAATVLVLRPTPSGDDVEVLLVRRSHRASFMANAYVFPGGRVDPEDAVHDGQPDAAGAGRRCALRELREEVGIRFSDETLAARRLVYFAHWITPSAEPKRFDTEFFLAELPAGQAPIVDEKEVFDLRWLTPRAALALYAEQALNLPPPTVCTLEDLAAEVALVPPAPRLDAGLCAALFARTEKRRPYRVMPRLLAEDGAIHLVMPWDPAFATASGDGELVPSLAEGAAAVPQRICRCTLRPPGGWSVARSAT